jgi:hypothetical protein
LPSAETRPSSSILFRVEGSLDVRLPTSPTRLPFGKTISSKSTPIEPDLFILFAGVTCVMRPSTIAPAGITVRPFTYTGTVTVALNLSPTCAVCDVNVLFICTEITVSGGIVQLCSADEVDE